MAAPELPATATMPSLSDAAWLIAPSTQCVMAVIAAGGFEARAVGGVVRNALFGLPVTDIDIATTAKPQDVMRLARAAGLAVVETGLQHGTVTVIVGHHPFEVTTLRRDVETHGRHATVAFTDDWAEDARRRDFTMNALYCDAGGRLHDPLDGMADLRARRVRFIGQAGERIREDYLRILRFFRFTAQYSDGDYDAAGLQACTRERAGLAQLSAERIRQELVRLLVAPGAVAAIEAMQAHGVLAQVLPFAPRPSLFARVVEIDRGHGLAGDAMVRLAALAVELREDAVRLAEGLRLSREERGALLLGSSDEARLAEAVGLAAAIDLEVVLSASVGLQQLTPATLIGSGKVEEFAAAISEHDIELVVVDYTVSPVQQRNLEKAWKAKVLDRTGLILEIFGARDSRSRDYAFNLGLALQLTNIIRDVGEDARRGRIYLPMDEMQQFGVTAADILNARETENFQKLMAFQIERAQKFYDQALTQLPDEDRKSQCVGLIMAAIYRATLIEVANSGCHVLKERVSLTPTYKLWLAFKTWLKN